MANDTRTKDNGPLIRPDIGIDDKAREQIVNLLQVDLANLFTLYTKTRKYHWNVTGRHFGPLHELFEKQYDAMAEEMDEAAERIRQLGGLAIGTLAEMQQCTTLQEQPGHNPDAAGMIRDLVSDHEIVIRQFREDLEKADELGDAGTNDFLTTLMEAHEKMAWMLRAHLEGEEDEGSDR
jgi:starvation-inducible DNA-binding protein